MAIKITYSLVANRISQFAVAISCGTPPQPLVIGYVTQVDNQWVARPRGLTADNSTWGFQSRSDAAAFLIENGKFACRPEPAAMQVAA